jgi:hypothetical protein
LLAAGEGGVSDFPERLRLKEKADEDLYFARRDRELIAALRRRRRALIALRSGGQTGVDRGALDAALALSAKQGLVVGGWCPRGRRAEDGVIDARYPLTETPSADPAQRTEWNVRDADATLILSRCPLAGGTALTAALADRLGKPLLCIDPSAPDALTRVDEWLRANSVRELNVAGPRESQAPGIAAETRALISRLLTPAANDPKRDGSGSP